MNGLRFSAIVLIVSDICLVTAIGTPWIMLTGGALQSNTFWASPISIIWYSANTPSAPVGSAEFVLASIMYILGTFGIVWLSAPVIRGGIHGTAIKAFFPGVIICVTICGALPFFLWLLEPALNLMDSYADSSTSLGLPMAILGTLAATISFFMATPKPNH